MGDIKDQTIGRHRRRGNLGRDPDDSGQAKKMSPDWDGPYVVIGVVSSVSVMVGNVIFKGLPLLGVKSLVYSSAIKLYLTRKRTKHRQISMENDKSLF